MTSRTQKQWVISQLKENGEITRNQCLKNYISRLSGIIQVLEEEGWTFYPHRLDGDYVYTVIDKPMRVVYEHDLINRVRVPRKTLVPV